MKEIKKDKTPEDNRLISNEHLLSIRKIEQDRENISFPQENEEQRSMDIRMQPQPLVEQKKSED